ncbi:MAG: hypothetical protein ACI9TH_001967 [Kiritimatiellia bacterium]|jgi:hypothetical protein
MPNDELNHFMQEYPTRIISDGSPSPTLMEQLRFAALLMKELPSMPVGPALVYRLEQQLPQSATIGGGLVVGRNEKADLAVHVPEMSSRHFEVSGEGTLSDLGSSNGTYVNQSRVEGTQPLTSGDVIEAGGQLFLFVDLEG